MSGIQQALHQCFVAGCELALITDRTIPFKAVGFKGIDDALVGAGLLTRWVDILHPQQPFALVDARLQIAGDGGQ